MQSIKREVSERVATDWLILKTEYLRTELSLRALAALHGVGLRQLQRVAAGEGWAAARLAKRTAKADEPAKPTRASPAQKAAGKGHGGGRLPAGGTLQPGAPALQARRGAVCGKPPPTGRRAPPASTAPLPPDADTQARLRAISEQLTSQLARAAGQLDKQVLRHKRKTRELVYEGGEPRGKPVEETVQETCEIEIVDAPVSCEGLQRLASTLKNLNDILKTGGGDEQSVGMVAALMKKLDEAAMKEEP